MKKWVVLLLFNFAVVCNAAPKMGTPNVPNQGDVNNTENIAPVTCNSYETCLELGLSDRLHGKDSVLVYFSDSSKETRYNVFENINVKLSGNICPPLVTIYKSVNNINYLMDIFSNKSENGCILYYSNITGENRNRDSIVGQLELMFCNKDELYESCDQGILYVKINSFNKNNKKDKDPKEPEYYNNNQNTTDYLNYFPDSNYTQQPQLNRGDKR